MAYAEPVITVVIPTFRRPKLLRRAILSVLNQTFQAFQVCVYDDASNDETQSIVAELAKTDSRVKYWRHKQNIGFIKNFNYGLKEVDTPFFSFLCDDDVLLPHFLEQAIQSLTSNPDVMFYAGPTIMVKNNKVSHIAKAHGQFGYLPPPEGVIEILSTGGLMLLSIVFRSEVKDSVGLLDADVGTPADVDFELRIAAHHPIIISNEPNAIFDQHEGSISTSSSDLSLIWPGFQIMSDKLTSDVSLSSNVRTEIRDLVLDKWTCWHLSRIGELAIVRGESDTVRAVAELLESVCNKDTGPAILRGLLKVKEVSQPAYCVVNIARRLFNSCLSLNNILARKKASIQLQKRYGGYLHLLTDYE